MAKLFDIRFTAETSEIETGYKAFQNRYLLKRKVLYTIVYIIVLVLGIDLIVKNPSGIPGYIASGLALGILLFNWIKPVMIRKKLMASLDALGTSEEYEMSFYDNRIEVETIIDPNAQTETVAITANGIYTVEEGSEAEKELPENVREQVRTAEVERSVYRLSETELTLDEKNGLLLVYINRSNFQTIPLRCLSEEQAELVRSYFSERSLTA